MVTPLSQFVGTQSAINVITGERYKQVSDETIQYALGAWGREALEHMDESVRDRILDRPRAKEIEAMEVPQPTLEEVRTSTSSDLSGEELVIRAYVDDAAVKFVRNLPPVREEPIGHSPLVALVAQLAAQSAQHEISVTTPEFSVNLSKA